MFSKKKKCRVCGEKVEESWDYCPFCGSYIGIEKEFEPFKYFEKMFEESFEMFNKIFEEKPRFSRGISIIIRSEGGENPKIYVRTKGIPVKEEKVKVPIEEVESEEKEIEEKAKEVKITEEPSFKILNENGKKVIEVNLPEVKSLDDIKIKKLSQSIEIRAFSGEKAFFNLIPIESNEKIVKKEFKDGKLRIYVE